MTKSRASKIIDRMTGDSPVAITESIVADLNSRVRKAGAEIRKDLARNFFDLDAKRIQVKEDAEYQEDGISEDLANAIDYVIDCVDEKGDSELTAAITQAANMFGVSVQDLEAFFNDNDQDGDAVRYEGFLGSLDRAIKEGKDAKLTFGDKSTGTASVNEAKVLLTVYGTLKEENQKVMLDLMKSSKTSFKKMLTFAQGVA